MRSIEQAGRELQQAVRRAAGGGGVTLNPFVTAAQMDALTGRLGEISSYTARDVERLSGPAGAIRFLYGRTGYGGTSGYGD